MTFSPLPAYFLKGKDLIGKYSFLVDKMKVEFLARKQAVAEVIRVKFELK